MSWIPPVTRTVKYGIKYGVKYGPQAKMVWDASGKQIQSVAKSRFDGIAARRKAFAEADGLVEGSVLSLVRMGQTIQVVFAGDDPVSAYPPVEDLAGLVAKVDLSKRVTTEQHRDAQLRGRTKRAGQRARLATRQAAKGVKRARPAAGPAVEAAEHKHGETTGLSE